jgi:hypothetical protein
MNKKNCYFNTNLLYIENTTEKSIGPPALPILVGCGLIENFIKCDISILLDYVTFLFCSNNIFLFLRDVQIFDTQLS